jgi:hypothetical protein
MQSGLPIWADEDRDMTVQLLANAFAAICIVVVLIRFVLLCRDLLKGVSTVFPDKWPAQRRRRLERTRSVLWFIGPVSWFFWFLLPQQEHLGFNHGLLATDTAMKVVVLAAYIVIWLQAISPSDYSKNSVSKLLVPVSLFMSILTIIYGLLNYLVP